MKTKNSLYALLSVAMLSSCADTDKLEFNVEKPESIGSLEYLNSYAPLKSYVDRVANTGFKLGTGVSISEFNQKGLPYRLVCANYDEMTAGYAMKHGAIVGNDGSLSLAVVDEFIENARSAGVSIFGHTLCWHSNQNASYLNSIIAPYSDPDSDGPPLEDNLVGNYDFENGTSGWGGWGNGMTLDLSAEADGYESDYSMQVTNPSAVNFWEVQFVYILPETTVGSEYILNLRVKGSQAGAVRACLQSSDWTSDDFKAFAVTTEWQTIETSVVVTSENRNRLLFSIGDYSGTLNFDDITVRRVNPNGGTIEFTPEQKSEIIDSALEEWVSGMSAVCRDYVKAWDVVNEPMSDWPDPYQLKTGVGKDNMSSDEFYWQDYLGKDYAVRAIELARQYGNEDDILFINDYGLESNTDKCKGLIEYVKYVESKGARVDGIGTQMHVSLNSADREKIREMFRLLAATGKLIKISELDMGIGDGVKTEDTTIEQQQQQAELYTFIIRTYFEEIPSAQRYGITHWSPLDSPEDSSWRGGEPIGLWGLDYNRKPAYAGFAEGFLSGN